MQANVVGHRTLKAEQYLARPHRLLIDGEWRDALQAGTFPVTDPTTGKVIAHVAEGLAEDIDVAVKAARRSYDDQRWRGLTADDRSRVLWRFADLLSTNAEELTHLEVANNGMPLALAQMLVTAAGQWLRHFGGLGLTIFGKNASNAISGRTQKVHAYTSCEPVGVAGLILPWNGPINTFVLKVAPALAAGCSVVVKPAENTPLTALRLGELALEAGVPPGVLNIVTGFGATAGQALVEHDQVNKISFTGSTAIGKQIVKTATGNLKRVTLELGGKSPCIIFDDADMTSAVAGAASGIFTNTGQACCAGSRLFVQRKSFERVVAGIANIAKSIKVGNGLDPDTGIGPLISSKQKQRVVDYIASGREEGAEVVTGGGAVDRDGYFVEPTVFANVNADMRIVREEIFGPVLVATPFDGIEDVVRAANDSRYGLAAVLFTQNLDTAHVVAGQLEAGTVWINGYGVFHPTMPFGGYKESGWGREMSSEGLDAYLEKKSVVITLKHG